MESRSSEQKRADSERQASYRNERSPEIVSRQREADRIRKQNVPRSAEQKRADSERQTTYRSERSPEKVSRQREIDRIRKHNMRKAQSAAPLSNDNDVSLLAMDAVNESNLDMVAGNELLDNVDSPG